MQHCSLRPHMSTGNEVFAKIIPGCPHATASMGAYATTRAEQAYCDQHFSIADTSQANRGSICSSMLIPLSQPAANVHAWLLRLEQSGTLNVSRSFLFWEAHIAPKTSSPQANQCHDASAAKQPKHAQRLQPDERQFSIQVQPARSGSRSSAECQE